MNHPNADLLRAMFEAFATRDLAAMQRSMTEDVRWHTPGNNLLAADRAGIEDVLEQLGASGQLSDGTYRTEVHDVLASDEHAAVLYTGRATRNGRSAELEHVGLFAIRGGRVSEVWIIPRDQAAFDTFWSD